jgi:2-(1,2-epoxy-1,2-dihydrophenyl)acetyl-CoA isomerase
MTDAPPVLEQTVAGVCTITLNRPDRLNALTRALMLDLRAAVDRACEQDAVRVICLTGAGRGFCAGQDLSERDPRKLAGPLDLEAIQADLFHPIVLALTGTPKPVVARVNGVAAGAGSSLALAADIVVAGRSARFVQSFAKVGLSVDAGGGAALVRALGPARAKAILMLGEALSGEEAQAAGLIWQVVDDEGLDEATDALTARLAATPRAALAGIKAAVAAADRPLAEYLKEEARLQGIAGRHPDYGEGVLSFLERRKPNFG